MFRRKLREKKKKKSRGKKKKKGISSRRREKAVILNHYLGEVEGGPKKKKKRALMRAAVGGDLGRRTSLDVSRGKNFTLTFTSIYEWCRGGIGERRLCSNEKRGGGKLAWGRGENSRAFGHWGEEGESFSFHRGRGLGVPVSTTDGGGRILFSVKKLLDPV